MIFGLGKTNTHTNLPQPAPRTNRTTSSSSRTCTWWLPMTDSIFCIPLPSLSYEIFLLVANLANSSQITKSRSTTEDTSATRAVERRTKTVRSQDLHESLSPISDSNSSEL